MESEEDQFNYAQREILSGNIEKVFQALKKKLESKIKKKKELCEKSVYILFAKVILGKCYQLIKSEIYKNVSQLIQLSQIILCCCRLVKLANVVEDALYHRALYHFFTFFMEQSLHQEAAELAIALHELMQSKNAKDDECIAIEKVTVSKNTYILCWNEAVNQQQKNTEVSLHLYLASMVHLSFQNMQHVHEKMKQILIQFLSTGVAIERMDNFAYDLWAALLENQIHSSSEPASILSDSFGIIYVWLRYRYKYATDDPDSCILFVFEETFRSKLGGKFPLFDAGTTILEIIAFAYKFGPLETCKCTGFDKESEKVRKWLDVLENPSCEMLLPELYEHLTLFFRVAACTAGRQGMHFASPTPIELLPLFVTMFKYKEKHSQLSSGVKDKKTVSMLWLYVKLFVLQVKTEVPLLLKEPADVQEKFSECCFGVAETLNNCFSFESFENDALLAVELTILGTFLYNKRLGSLAIAFLEPFFNIMSSSILSSEPSTSELHEQDIAKGYEVLALCHMSCGNVDQAFAVVAQCLASFGLKFPDIFRIWIKIKTMVAKEQLFTTKRTIKSELDALEIDLSAEVMFHLMKMELASYISSNRWSDFEEDAFKLVTDMLEISDNPLEVGPLYIQMTRLAFCSSSQFVQKSMKETLQKIIDLLEHGTYTNNQSTRAKSLLAQAYFWMYQIKWKEVQIEADIVGIGKKKIWQSQKQEEGKREIIEAYPHVCFSTEVQLHSILDKAVDLWNELLTVDHVWVPEHEEICTLKVLTEVYSGAQRVQQMVKLQQILIAIGHKQRNAKLLLYGGSRMALFLTRNGYVLQAKLLLDCSESSAKKCTNYPSLNKDYDILRFQLVRAENCLHASELAEGLKYLLNVLDITFDEKGKHMILIDAEARTLKAKFGRVSSAILNGLPELEQFHLMEQSPIVEALNAIKLCIFLNKCIVDGTIARECVIDWYWYRQLLLNAEMESASVLGQLFLEIGGYRESQCYLNESLTLAQEMLLITRGVENLLLLAHMDLLCGNWNECLVKLQAVFYTLDAETPEDINICKTPVKVVKPKVIESPFLTAKVDAAHDEDEDVFMDNPSTPSKFHFSRSHPSQQHTTDCVCNHCQYSSLELQRLKALWLQEICLAKKEGTEEACIEGVFANLKDFEQKYCKQINDSCSFVMKTVKLLKIKGSAFKLEVSKSVSLNEFLLLKCQVLSSLGHEIARSGDFQKAIHYLTIALRDIRVAKACHHMLAAINSQLLLERVELKLRYISSAQGKNWVQILVHDNLQNNQVSSLSNLLSNFHLVNDSQPLKEVNTPKNATNSRSRKTLNKAPQKKTFFTHKIVNFNEPSPQSHHLNGEPTETVRIRKTRSSVRTVCSRGKKASVTRKHLSRQNNENISPKKVANVQQEDKVRALKNKHERIGLNFEENGAEPRIKEGATPPTIETFRFDEDDMSSPEILRGRKDNILQSQRTPENNVECNPTRSRRRRQLRNADNNLNVEVEDVRNSVSSFKTACSKMSDEFFDCEPERASSVPEMPMSMKGKPKTENSDHTGIKAYLKGITEDLLAARSLIFHHPPYKIFSKINLLLAMIFGFKECQDKENKLVGTYYFSESVSITLRHQSVIRLQKRIRDGLKDGIDCPSDRIKESILHFCKNNEQSPRLQIQEALERIPAGWTVLQVCGVSSKDVQSVANQFQTPNLVLCRICKDSPPIFGFVPTTELELPLLKEFNNIMEQSLFSLKTSKPEVWWTARKELDHRMKDLCHSMENEWLGMWKALFLGKVVGNDYNNKSSKSVARILQLSAKFGLACCDEQLLQAIVDGKFGFSSQQLTAAVAHLWKISPSDPANQGMCNAISMEAQQLNNVDATRHPVILILDKHVQHLPWESMPLLRNRTVTRIPSLHMLQAQLESYNFIHRPVFKEGINPQETFYVLNPRNDLPKTQLAFEEKFKRLNWSGVVAQKPTREEMVSAVTEHDLFLYCGHGSGNSCLSGDNVEKLKCRAAVVLMGCSSGKLRVLGEMEPTGIVQQYWMSGSPMILANLWDVTDKDIDRFTEHLLRRWLGKENTCVSDAVSKSRDVCILSYLIGCAPVIYGLPVFSSRKVNFPES